jgi:hypothetical protein
MMSVRKDDVSSEFNRQAVDELPETAFCAYLTKKFDRATAVKVIDSFKKMDLPPPQDEKEFLTGTEGCLVFLNKYALVMRIEIADLEDSKWGADRINDSGWIMQPLASLDAGKAIIEICPGCHLAEKPGYRGELVDQLQNQNINFWDTGISNIGHLPFKTPTFPDGVPVVIDRLAVIRLTRNTEPIREALKAQAEEAKKAQDMLYGPLREAFASAWPEAGKMGRFWSLCLRYAAEGKLVSGWENPGLEGKSWYATYTAKNYETRLKRSTTLQQPKPD